MARFWRVFSVLAALFLLLFGCFSSSPPSSPPIQPEKASANVSPSNESSSPPLSLSDSQAVSRCIQACQQALKQGRPLQDGPCLQNPIENSLWVCDVAHWPRQPADNDGSNQCPAFTQGKASRFVEVTPDCSFIRTG